MLVEPRSEGGQQVRVVELEGGELLEGVDSLGMSEEVSSAEGGERIFSLQTDGDASGHQD